LTRAHAIRLLTSLADMLDNQRATSPEDGDVLLCLSPDFALQFASAAEHGAEALAKLPETEEEEDDA
jgi:hypothetical protein